MKLKIVLIGNPNCGKTTLFNRLTGLHQHTGNWTGVTNEEKTGICKYDKSIEIIDLPGLYSLDYKSADEKVVTDYIKNNKIDAIINVIDGTNTERNLYLTTELISLDIPIIVAVNMSDELRKDNIIFNCEYLRQLLNVEVIEISAKKNIDIKELITISKSYKNKPFNHLNLNTPEIRQTFIKNNINKIISKKQTKAQKITQKADNILTHKIWGIPICFTITFIIYYLSVKGGGFFGNFIISGVGKIREFIYYKMTNAGMSNWIITLITSGVLQGAETLLSFVPQILILFFLLSLMEESGISSRFAFLLDSVFYNSGLSGKSMFPLTLSCGCTVTGLMSTRGIESVKERILTIFLIPFMPCSAKSAVFSFLCRLIFDNKPIIPITMYLTGLICIFINGVIINKFYKISENSQFIMEMPTLRLPGVKEAIASTIERLKEFLLKAGLIIVIMSIILWAMKYFGFNGYTYGKTEDSFLYLTGNLLKHIFVPLGFSSWQTTVALITGIFAREAVAETLTFVTNDVSGLFNYNYEALSFMTFILLSPPCIASLTTARNELKNRKLFIKMLIFQFMTAYIVSLIINIVGIMIHAHRQLHLFIIVGIIIVVILMIICTRKIYNRRSKNVRQR